MNVGRAAVSLLFFRGREDGAIGDKDSRNAV